jgi:coenzyme F420-reducing hydrogenase delta subunit
MVLKSFKEGADGVFVGGCHMGDCHYDAGIINGEGGLNLLKICSLSLELIKKGSDSNGYQPLRVKNSRKPWKSSVTA